jgi:hypothetical protein
MKKIQIYLIMFVMLFANSVLASDVFIEQIGSSSEIKITQQGTANRIGNSLTPSFFGGDSDKFTIEQVGTVNELDLLVNGNNTTVTLSTFGSGNIEDIICGSKTKPNSCDNALIDYRISGNDNKIITNLGDADKSATSKMVISGKNNIITHTGTHTSTTGFKISADLNVTGDFNKIDLTQSGSGNETIKVDTTGNNNIISINQTNNISLINSTIPIPNITY